MPRRYVDYPDAYAGWNYISSLGSYVFADRLGHLLLFTFVQAFARKQRAAANPWGAGATTLEWTLSSPPPFHQFERLPVIKVTVMKASPEGPLLVECAKRQRAR